MDFYGMLVHMHSGLRWVILLLLIYAIINAARSISSGKYLKKDKMVNLFTMISLHVQLLIGLALYFINARGRVDFSEGWMSNAMSRFYGLEHIALMIVAIAIITIGRSRAEKKLEGTRNKHRAILMSYTIGLILILLSIPWPFWRWASFGAGLG
ncbi:MAG: cytochrome B [Fluviicola sp. XM-24bin1]|nr:MAG: cytochrome B [Fluviicola sp. XM-24bin1]